MSCIEAARKDRKEFEKNLRSRGFPPKEAHFLTHIAVEKHGLLVYGYLDLGRMMSELLEEYKRRFPEVAEEIRRHNAGQETKRHWVVSSGLLRPTDIQPGCLAKVSNLEKWDPINQIMAID